MGDLASDHLLSLTRAKVYRALLANIALLGLPVMGLCEANILSPFNLAASTQRSFHHHPWLYIFPYPQVRDNLIRAQGHYGKDQLRLDILGFWDPGAPENTLWDVTESFIKKRGWVICGRPEILHSTNQWRARRGENLIFRYL
ncbi:hypothetical protein BDV27DRAFT_143765 [Aspergillus caelatus]|uniref:Uncharacterized protein n=1 Tax=Aspergillus caelatus TaxID=61420 RepID=A0A5N7A8P7_9EURO|nr:uncharacterized protein BDV27DRAFT_143765 [Aspergillus caelatus]KAE8366247.1 hypothetical protein BDV27DRAFT_143765 [Aspergillus caelatus]